MSDLSSGAPIDVAIIGGGPSGLSAATELKKQGVTRVVVLERENEAGGIPRHCGHPPFGMREFRRILAGPKYARKLVETALAAGVEIHTLTTVVEALPGGELRIIADCGVININARRIIYATGVRETPRSARLISGDRPHGVINTGALQSMIYLKGRRPFQRPVIIGSELVSFSAIMTCRHAKIKPVAMIEAGPQVIARWPSGLFPRMAGIPLHLNTTLIRIEGDHRVRAVEVEHNGQRRRIECDGVILTGQFTPESSLARCGHLAVDPATGGPLIDPYGRCSDPTYFATGNIFRPLETAGWCWNEGRQTGQWVADDLAGKLADHVHVLHISCNDPLIKYAMPQKLTLPRQGMKHLQLRFTRSAKGDLVMTNGNQLLYRRSLHVHPERRVLVPIKELTGDNKGGILQLTFEETG